MESNKLIAEFLGAKPISLGASVEYEMYGIIECIKDGPNEKHFFIPDEMEFKEDWRWLIEAVKSCYDNGADSNQIGDITNAFLECNREDTYNAVVEFIKLYNKSKEPTVNTHFDEEDMWINCPHCDNAEQQPMDQQRHHLQSLVLLDWESEEISKHQCLSCDGLFKVNW